MVHKKFIKSNGRTYGPYFYESYREYGKVKKRYVKIPDVKEGMWSKNLWIFFVLVGLVVLIFGIYYFGNAEEFWQIKDSGFATLGKIVGFSVEGEDLGDDSGEDAPEGDVEGSGGSGDEEIGGVESSEEIDGGTGEEEGGEEGEGIETEILDDENGTEINETEILDDENGTEINETEILDDENETEINETEILDDENETEIDDENETEVIIGMNEGEMNATEINVTTNLSFAGEIPTVRIFSGRVGVVELSEYFSGAKSYSFESRNVSAEFEGDVATLFADEGFSGAVRGKFVSFAGAESVESNEFLILVSSGAMKIQTLRDKIEVGKPVRWVKNVTLENPERVVVELPKEATNISVVKIEEGEEKKISAGITGSAVIETKGWNFFEWIRKLFSGITGRAISEENSSSENLSEEKEIIEVTLEDDATNYLVEYYTEAPVSAEENSARGKIVTVSTTNELGYTDVIVSAALENKISLSDSSKVRIYWYNYEKKEKIKRVAEVEDKIIVEENFGEVEGSELEEEIIEEEVLDEEIIVNESLEEETVEDSEEIIEEEIGEIEEGLGFGITGGVIKEFSDEEAESSGDFGNYVLQEVPFDYYDLDFDGKIDYVEWVAPHLSNQTFEIIIEISNAEHLDENRSLISNIYDSVSALEGIWSETINDGEYVRVTFEQPLDRTKDITVYARAACNETILINDVEVPCEIYLKKMRIDEIRGERG